MPRERIEAYWLPISTQVVKLLDLDPALPKEIMRVTAEERQEQIEQRRAAYRQ